MRKHIAIAMMAATTAVSVHAGDLFPDGKPMAFESGMYLPSGTTMGGYPIYPGFDAWRLMQLEVSNADAQGGADSVRLGISVLADFAANADDPRAIMVMVANLSYAGVNQYWTGEPCKGAHLFALNKGGGTNDNCITIDVVPPSDRWTSTKLEVKATQSASSGRMLRIRMLLDPSQFGLAHSTERDWNTEALAQAPERQAFMQRLQKWADSFLDASHKALAFSKPQDAYTAVPGLNALSPSPTPATVTQ